MRRGYGIALGVVGLSVLVLAACEGLAPGPSLSAVAVTNVRTQATIGDPSLCCCHVLATARNNNTVPVHATIKFAALDRPLAQGGQEMSRTVFFIENFAPSTTQNIDASGFLFPCNQVGEIRYELSVRGLTEPAP